MEKEQLQEKIRGVAKNGKISCREALRLASEEGISSRELGNMLNEMKIKIAGCQLGCFP